MMIFEKPEHEEKKIDLWINVKEVGRSFCPIKPIWHPSGFAFFSFLLAPKVLLKDPWPMITIY